MRIYQLDAFTDQLFSGNPAAVIPLTEWLPDEQMQRIASENNLAETAFYVKTEGDANYHIRWFTPTVEVDLCGHATLATGYVVFFLEQKPETDQLYFESRSGSLKVCRSEGGWLTLDFPADVVQKANVQPPALLSSLNEKPLEVYKGKTDYMLVFKDQAQIEALDPDFREMSTVPARGIIVTAPGDTDSGVDFVSRFFGPQSGIDEDPVTGSAHTTLVPYWAEKLGKTQFVARQLSKRGGELRCKLNDERVDISGKVQLYMTGEIM
ncbi:MULTISPECIES: PhzF family phenazine biosynthesis protein [Spirosoma]|uniref:PhzF family phenazine biosynthesis protein n=1 Tax=Spirosoma liriopis TaxID=2937440 RepID=A0ABT0HMR8_9BACT|nr:MULTISPECIES: PhzF family phenazine biosynthesis protein [Spirosoma]MCK8492860.1 PhzF family phenazine biosynthesis protein [Spirosoma liriopis]UHG92321.1 PhzF family phenazine biosynthesis protein [Spirosoma oryzicola]